MKKLTTIIFAALALLGYNPLSAQSKPKSEQDTICFSKEKFEEVYQYIEKQINNNNIPFFAFEDYQIYLEKDTKRISMKKKGHNHARINATSGITSINKSAKGHKRIVKEAHEVFCRLYQRLNKH